MLTTQEWVREVTIGREEDRGEGQEKECEPTGREKMQRERGEREADLAEQG